MVRYLHTTYCLMQGKYLNTLWTWFPYTSADTIIHQPLTSETLGISHALD